MRSPVSTLFQLIFLLINSVLFLMKNLSYTKLKEKVKKANKKEYYALLAVLWWIPLGSIWCAIAIWLRSSNQIKSFLGLKKNLNE